MKNRSDIIKRFIFTIIYLTLISICFYQLFFPIYQANEIVVSFGLHPSDICYDNPLFWKYLKTSFIFFYIFSNLIILNSLISRLQIFETSTVLQDKKDNNITSLQLLIGKIY